MKMNLFDSSSQDYFHQIYAQNVKYVLHNTTQEFVIIILLQLIT